MANKKNLRRLRDVIAAVPDDLLHMRRLIETADCGTAFCAAGWAATDPILGPQIARFPAIKYITHLKVGATLTTWDLQFVGFQAVKEALCAILDLDRKDGDRLFASHISMNAEAHAVTKAEVLWNIDQLLEDKPARRYRATRGDSEEDRETVPV